jgi:hypothetical protein
MAGRNLGFPLVVTLLLFPLTACRREQLSLPIAHAAQSTDKSPLNAGVPSPPQQSRPEMAVTPTEANVPAPDKSCYSFILMRPKDQRARAVQARLEQADRMAAAFDSHLVTVDIIGDHANILSLKVPVVWPAKQFYPDRVSSVVEDYFSSPDIEDYMCNSGFAEVRLSVRGLNDRRIHPIWTARVTSEGLLKDESDDDQVATSEPPSIR